MSPRICARHAGRESRQLTHWLPTEVGQHMLLFLDQASLIRAEATSRIFSQWVVEALMDVEVLHMDASMHSSALTPQRFAKLLCRMPRLNSIYAHACPAVTVPLLKELALSCYALKLHSLRITTCPAPVVEGVRSILVACSGLQELVLDGNGDSMGPELATFFSLFGRGLADEQQQRAGPDMQAQPQEAQAANHNSANPVEDEQKSDMKQLHLGLQNIAFRDSPKLNLHSIALLMRSTSATLQHLDLRGCDLLSDLALKIIGSKAIELRSLTIGDNRAVTDFGLKYLSQTHTSTTLHRLAIYTSFIISDVGLEALARTCTALREIEIRSCSHVSDTGMTKLIRACAKLARVTATHMSRVGDGTVSAAAQLSALNLLDVTSTQTSNVSVIELAKSATAPLLQSLCLRSCRLISDVSCTEVAKHCVALKHLDLHCCYQITGATLVELACGVVGLEFLDMSWCYKVGREDVACLLKKQSRLLRVVAVGCAHLVNSNGVHSAGVLVIDENMERKNKTCMRGGSTFSKFDGMPANSLTVSQPREINAISQQHKQMSEIQKQQQLRPQTLRHRSRSFRAVSLPIVDEHGNLFSGGDAGAFVQPLGTTVASSPFPATRRSNQRVNRKLNNTPDGNYRYDTDHVGLESGGGGIKNLFRLSRTKSADANLFSQLSGAVRGGEYLFTRSSGGCIIGSVNNRDIIRGESVVSRRKSRGPESPPMSPRLSRRWGSESKDIERERLFSTAAVMLANNKDGNVGTSSSLAQSPRSSSSFFTVFTPS